MLTRRIQVELTAHRKAVSDSEWHDLFFRYRVSHFWGFPHVIQALDFYCQVDISFAELQPYLKKGTPLARFAP